MIPTGRGEQEKGDLFFQPAHQPCQRPGVGGGEREEIPQVQRRPSPEPGRQSLGFDDRPCQAGGKRGTVAGTGGEDQPGKGAVKGPKAQVPVTPKDLRRQFLRPAAVGAYQQMRRIHAAGYPVQFIQIGLQRFQIDPLLSTAWWKTQGKGSRDRRSRVNIRCRASSSAASSSLSTWRQIFRVNSSGGLEKKPVHSHCSTSKDSSTC